MKEARIITAAVIKGGTGKTTTAAAILQAAAKHGKKALAIDLDPQANLTQLLSARPNGAGSYELLHGREPLDVIQSTPQGIDAISATPDLSTEQTTPGSAKRLSEALQGLSARYDYIIIDTPPSIGELTFNALQASDTLLIPIEADGASIQGLYYLSDIAEHLKKSNPKLKHVNTVITRYDGRAKLSQYYKGEIERRAAEINAPLLAVIRAGVAVREAQAFRRSLFDYAPKSKPAEDYIKLYERIKEQKQ